MLELLLKSKAEVSMLGVVLFNDGLHLRAIAKEAGISPPEAKRELDILVGLGALRKEKKGNLLLFYQNKECDFLVDLKNLYLKTEGLFGELILHLKKLQGIEYAFVFGSMSTGKFREKSDLDLMVIGNIREEMLAEAMFNIQKKTKRAINFILWSENDFRKKLREKSKFLGNISESRKWIAGNENGFERIVAETYDRKD